MYNLISLFDYSGNWSKPYLENGWNVIRIDRKIKNPDNINLFNTEVQDIDADWMYENIFENFEEIHGILAAPPCTDFAVSGAKHQATKDLPKLTLFGVENRLDYFINLTRQTLRIIDICNPIFYAIENPIGRIKKLIPEIGEPWYFQPYWYGDAYSKKTGLYGKFNKPEPTNIVEPVMYSYGSKTQKYGGKSEKTKELRSITPMGFSNAFYQANNLNYLKMRIFFIQDKSGRLFTTKCSLDYLINGWDNDEDNNGQLMHEWAHDAEIGDEWECYNLKIVRIE